ALEAQLRTGPIEPISIEPPPRVFEPLTPEDVATRRARARNRVAGILLHRVLERWDGAADVEPLLLQLAGETAADEATIERVRRRAVVHRLGGRGGVGMLNVEW